MGREGGGAIDRIVAGEEEKRKNWKRKRKKRNSGLFSKGDE